MTSTMLTPSLKTALPSPSAGPALTSLRSTRRLRGSASVKGAQSPGLFVSVNSGRRRGGSGAGFDTAEPTSPKVTCIGRVRVKTGRKMMQKKKVAAAALSRSRSRGYRRSAGVQGGICDAVRAFGSELNCFLLCGAGGGGGRSSVCCSRSDRDKADGGSAKRAAGVGGSSSSSCGAVFARWIMATHETEERKRGEVAVDDEMVGTGAFALEESDEELVEERRFRRGIRALELLADELQNGGTFPKEGFGGLLGEAPSCAPPKNALLLMRCRADPVKLSALQNRFKEANVEVEDDVQHVTAGTAQVAASTQRVHEVYAKDHYFAAAAERRAIHDKLQQHFGNNRALEGEGVTQEGLPKLEEKKDEVVAQESGISRRNLNGLALSEEETPQRVEEEEDKSNEEETNLEEEDEEKRLLLVEPLQAPDTSQAEKENKVLRFPLQPAAAQLPDKSQKQQQQLVRRDLLLAGGEMEGGRWSFSKDRELLVGDGVRRHSFSTEEARRSSSFREEEVMRRSSFSHQACDSVRRSSSFSSAYRGDQQRDSRDGSGRRCSGQRTISKEKEDTRRRSVQESEPGANAVAATTDCSEGIEEAPVPLAAAKSRDEAREESASAENNELPDCLRLMMSEPKLSLEISQETWVCTDDFQRWKPQQKQRRSSCPKPQGEAEHHSSNVDEEEGDLTKPLEVVPEQEGSQAAADSYDAVERNRNITTNDHVSNKQPATLPTTEATIVKGPPPPRLVAAVQPQQPPPLPPSALPELATKSSADRKLDNATTAAIAAVALGPLVLTRCKSEPMRTSPRLLLPEDYSFWKSHHHRHALGF